MTNTSASTNSWPVPDQQGVDLFETDPALKSLLPLYIPSNLLAHLTPHLGRLGKLAGGELDHLASVADKNPPQLVHRTRSGMDRQSIDKHPAYVEMERLAFSEFGLAALSHRGGVLGWPEPMVPAAKYALTFLFVQAEFGLCCPVSMTDSLTRTLRRFGDPQTVARYLPALTTLDFDQLAQGAMFMTEQGAGSDIAATQTRAYRADDGTWRLEGDKWFCSNPDAGFAMVLARHDGGPAGMKGVSLFLLPKFLDDGTHNRYRIIRLKDKLGTRSMASGEIRLEGASAILIGELGRGFVQMADMVNNSRLSNGVRAAGLMRRAVSEAFFIARNRQAFGRRLIELPLMRRQLMKLLVPSEQARTMMFQTADALRRADAGDANAYSLLRILTPLLKFRACRDARKVTGDAMEVRGGCGYIEEWSDPRLVRDAHLGSIWEGTSNIVALDVMRAIRRENSLAALALHLDKQMAASGLDVAARAPFADSVRRACKLADAAAAAGGEALARRAASALYHVASAVGMAWESGQIGTPDRLQLARLVLEHRVAANDPLAIPDDAHEDVLPAWLDAAPAA
ncbi:MAG TPA: acyl-CoA dehydrogenase family protein [Burkholderiaceae bacterium]|nr:acyl-CoA dehydrogenase family protein [Burkholderiaceae bacterium]